MAYITSNVCRLASLAERLISPIFFYPQDTYMYTVHIHIHVRRISLYLFLRRKLEKVAEADQQKIGQRYKLYVIKVKCNRLKSQFLSKY